MDGLSKMHRFEEAAEIKIQLEEELNKNVERFEKDIQEKLENIMQKFDKKQENELISLQTKLNTSKNEL